MEVLRFDGEGGAGGVVNEAFGGGSEEQFFKSGPAPGSKNDKIGFDFLKAFRDSLVDGESAFHDVARAVLEEKNFENRMLKGYIKNWPA